MEEQQEKKRECWLCLSDHAYGQGWREFTIVEMDHTNRFSGFPSFKVTICGRARCCNEMGHFLALNAGRLRHTEKILA